MEKRKMIDDEFEIFNDKPEYFCYRCIDCGFEDDVMDQVREPGHPLGRGRV